MQDRFHALDRQIGGDHYTQLALRPTDFALANGWDAAAHQILKYITRHRYLPREKAIESLRKALHLVEIRVAAINEQRMAFAICSWAPRHTAAEYCTVNQIGDAEVKAIMYLAAWVYGHDLKEGGSHRMVWNAIEDVLLERYGVGA